MNENEIQAFIDTFNSSREKQRNADLHTQIEELFEQNQLFAEAIVKLARAQS